MTVIVMASLSSRTQPHPPDHHRSAAPVIAIVAFGLLLVATAYAIIRYGAASRPLVRSPFEIGAALPDGGVPAQGPSTAAAVAGDGDPASAALDEAAPAGEEEAAGEAPLELDQRQGGTFVAPPAAAPGAAGPADAG
ncbi:MAG TPA: hypothetical protein VGK73_04515, partial [Polyangiaceae bacterium]